MIGCFLCEIADSSSDLSSKLLALYLFSTFFESLDLLLERFRLLLLGLLEKRDFFCRNPRRLLSLLWCILIQIYCGRSIIITLKGGHNALIICKDDGKDNEGRTCGIFVFNSKNYGELALHQRIDRQYDESFAWYLLWLMLFVQYPVYNFNFLMPQSSFLQASLIFFTLAFLKPLSLASPPTFAAQTITLFLSNTTSLTPSRFLVPFGSSFTIAPSISYGINHYQMGDRFYYENMLTLITHIQRSQFQLSVYPIGSTFIFRFSINYLAINDPSHFLTWSRSYPNPIASVLSGSRSVTLYESYNFSHSNVAASIFITGFHIQSINGFSVWTEVGNFSRFGFHVRVGTGSDCRVSRIDVSFLFYYPDQVAGVYLVRVSQGFCFSNLTSDTVTVSFPNESRVFLLGMSGFSGETVNSRVSFGWEVSYASSPAVTFNTANLLSLCYNFIQISTIQQTIEGTDEGKDYTIVIVIAVCSLVAAVLIACGLFRCCKWRSRHSEMERVKQTKKRLSVATLNELPSLHF